MNKKITIRPEEHKDYKSIILLILRSFQEGTDYSECTGFAGWLENLISYNIMLEKQIPVDVAGWSENLISYNKKHDL